jgi:hypothetical protein
MLKVSAPYICSPLNYICNKSISSGSFPSRLKYSIVKQLFKKGDRDNMANYRPISLLTSFSKIFEKLIYERLLQHIKINNILSEEQFGFRPSTSTDKASYKLINEILNAMNERKMVGGIFCDLQKAFDCVNHNILISKLEFYGIAGKTLKLINSYLEGRYQNVVLDGNLSDSTSRWGLVRHGVPQGSILGPLLFLLYINDLPKIVKDKSEVVLYADDTSIIITNFNLTNITNTANKILQNIDQWFTSNLLSLNADKTHYMQFVTKTSCLTDLHVMCKNKEIENTDGTKFLGLTLDNTFTWKKHIDSIVPRLSSACFAVRAVKPILSQESLKMVYFSYFHSIMSYGLIFWGSSCHSNIVFKLQKRAIRIMMGIKDRESCREYFRKLKILPLQSQYIYSLLLFVVNNRQHFITNADVHSVNTRNNLDFHLLVYQKGVHYNGVRLFNILPSSIKQLTHDPKRFLTVLKGLLYAHSFYSIDEYFRCKMD